MATMQKLRAYQGPALFSYGFRPFFLFGAIYAGAMVPLWLVVFAGDVSLPTAFAPRDWHVHEMLFGYVCAVIAGFLLTAVPNWTGRLPIQGRPLAILFATWLAGRLAVTFSGFIGWEIALAVDAAFLLLLAAAAAREIVAGRKWNNLKVVGIISLLAVANIAFHVEAHLDGLADYSTRFGVGLVVTLVCVIGGRIVPSFTRNWLARREPGRLPVPFNRFDAITMVAGVCAMIAWVVAPSGRFVAAALGVAGLLHVVRLARWAGYRTVSDRLVLILHVAYAFVPAGFLLAALSAVDLVAAQRRDPRLDRRRDRFDDDRRDDPCFARPHRAGAFGVHRHPARLRFDRRRRAGADMRGARAVPFGPAADDRGRRVGGGVSGLRARLRAAAMQRTQVLKA